MTIIVSKIITISSLGLVSIWRVLWFRFSLRVGANPLLKIKNEYLKGEIFVSPYSSKLRYQKIVMEFFGWKEFESVLPPNWYENPFTGTKVLDPHLEWHKIPDFDSEVGDIKAIWELSRFNWVIKFSMKHCLGDNSALPILNNLLIDWCDKNPPYIGPNWKCGQEASFRVIHLLVAHMLHRQESSPTLVIKSLVKIHLERIAPTISYAIGQDNNHGTSESVALFLGGSWLAREGDMSGMAWERLGRKWLENRARRLIEDDGSFSQYSVNYHRVMLDTYSMAEVWRRHLDLKPFSSPLYEKLRLATNWLYQLVQPENGHAPNIGANDGALLCPLGNSNYRDFRPSVQLSMALFFKQRAYPVTGQWNDRLEWLGVPVPDSAYPAQRSIQFDKGGYSVLRQDSAFVLLRYPRFRFRPSQADALHVDLWYDGENLLRDGGTYSYNSGDEALSYFAGTESHNTIQFDGRDQMRRLSRFLFADWLKAKDVTPICNAEGTISTSASYVDFDNATHRRAVELRRHSLLVIDSVGGFKEKAVLRWRLIPGNWNIDGSTVSNGNHRLIINSTSAIKRFQIKQGWESLYYLQKTPLPVLEIEIDKAGTLTTEYSFSS